MDPGCLAWTPSAKRALQQMTVWKKKKVVCTYNEYYLVLKRKEIRAHVTTQKNLQDVMLSEKKQSQKDKYWMIPLYGGPQVVNSIETERGLMVARGWGREKWEVGVSWAQSFSSAR